MGKFLVRITIFVTCVYFIASYLMAQYIGIDILYDCFIPLFILCVVVYCYSEGKYHCKHIKHLSLAIFLSDTLTRLDNTFDFLTVSQHNLIPIGILLLGILVSTYSAIRHFYKVKKIKNGRKKNITD